MLTQILHIGSASCSECLVGLGLVGSVEERIDGRAGVLQALKMKDKTENEAMLALVDMIVEHVRRRRAFFVVTPVRSPTRNLDRSALRRCRPTGSGGIWKRFSVC